MYAMSRMGRYDEALNTAYDCWGGQLGYGATTFFEVFRPSWNTISSPNDAPPNNQCGYTSFTHPWSAGITKWLSEEILGIKPTAPGFTSCTIMPRLSSRIIWVDGSIPTAYGKIKASFNISNGECKINIPTGVSATVGIPKAGRKIKHIQFGETKWKKLKEDKDFIYYQLSGGKYTATVSYTGDLPQLPEDPFTYQLTDNVKEDIETKGNWKTKYGTKGYVLCNYESAGENIQELPDFIESVNINRAGNVHWTHTTSDVRALQSPASGSQSRAIGAVTTRDPHVCQQTITIDIKAKENSEYTVSLYFIDWDEQDRRAAIEVFDLESKDLLQPLHMVRNYEGGKYVTFTFRQPVRLRINQVRGMNAAVSAIFFD